MDFLHAVMLGVVEGFTEFLPVSSTAHLVMASQVLGVEGSDFTKSFVIAIQLGAILSVVALYWRTFLRDWETNKRIATAFVPTALIGFALYKLVKGVLLESYALIGVVLALGGAALIAFEWWRKGKEERETPLAELPYRKAFLIGCAQALAIVPGVSRSAATIVGGIALGMSRKAVVEFSFLLAVPTMAAATGYDLLKSAGAFSAAQFDVLAVGFIVSFFAALAGVKFLLAAVKTHSFVPFGAYRIIIGAVFLGWLYL